MQPRAIQGSNKITIYTILSRVLVLIIISLIIGFILGDKFYRLSGWLSFVPNIFSAPATIGLGFILFGISYKLFTFWYAYPPLIYIMSQAFLGSDKMISLTYQGISKRLIASLAIFCIVLLIFALIVLISRFAYENRVTRVALTAACVLCVVPFGISYTAVRFISAARAPERTINFELNGVSMSPTSLTYTQFSDPELVRNQSGQRTVNRQVTDHVITSPLKILEKKTACDFAYNPSAKIKHATYNRTVTASGKVYGEASFERVISKDSKGNLKYAETKQYCFVISKTKYVILRDIPNDDTVKPTRTTVLAAHARYPINVIIDSFE